MWHLTGDQCPLSAVLHSSEPTSDISRVHYFWGASLGMLSPIEFAKAWTDKFNQAILS